jgi:ketosteroid isomerase-like protein
VTDEREALLREGWDAYVRGDIERTLATLDPAVVVHNPVTMANAGTYHGRDGFLTWIGQWNEAWESFTGEVVAIEPVGVRHLVASVRQTGVGRGSGVEVRMQTYWTYEIVNLLSTYVAVHRTLEDAVADARRREAGE